MPRQALRWDESAKHVGFPNEEHASPNDSSLVRLPHSILAFTFTKTFSDALSKKVFIINPSLFSVHPCTLPITKNKKKQTRLWKAKALLSEADALFENKFYATVINYSSLLSSGQAPQKFNSNAAG